jgi:hypothetical protein
MSKKMNFFLKSLKIPEAVDVRADNTIVKKDTMTSNDQQNTIQKAKY